MKNLSPVKYLAAKKEKVRRTRFGFFLARDGKTAICDECYAKWQQTEPTIPAFDYEVTKKTTCFICNKKLLGVGDVSDN